jgi:hypothetical protein
MMKALLVGIGIAVFSTVVETAPPAQAGSRLRGCM